MRKLLNGLYLLLFLYTITLISCQKTSDDPADALAIFNLVGADSACKATLVSGKFLTGQIMSTSEKLQVPIYISKKGKWSFSTDTINGFSFAANGEFTDTGYHMITLNASGIPSSPGTIFFSVTTGATKQMIPVSILKDNITVETVPQVSYAYATIDGVQHYVQSPVKGPDNAPHAIGGDDTVSLGSFVNSNINPIPAGSGALSIQKQFLYRYRSSTQADFKNFFQPGSYPFTVKLCGRPTDGMILFWSDSTGEPWTTLNEIGGQPDGYFAITGVEDGFDSSGIYFVKVRSRFKCRLYGLRSGRTRDLTDGEAVSYFKYQQL